MKLHGDFRDRATWMIELRQQETYIQVVFNNRIVFGIEGKNFSADEIGELTGEAFKRTVKEICKEKFQ